MALQPLERPPPSSPPVTAGERRAEGAGRLADMVLDVGETVAVRLPPAFADPDGDALTYSASYPAH